MSYNSFYQKDIERTLIDNAENTELRKKQVKETILNSVKACSKAGKVCSKELLLNEFERLGFPVSKIFIENILEDIKLEGKIIDCEGMLWIKGSGKLEEGSESKKIWKVKPKTTEEWGDLFERAKRLEVI